VTQGQYINFYDYDKDKVANLLKSTETDDKINGLLNTVLGSGDYEKSDDLISRFLDGDEISLKQNAILCIGHLVRIHKKVNLDHYTPILESILKNQDDPLVDNAEDALNDIWIFSDKEEMSTINKDTCVGRYFNILRISDSSKRDENYDKGIKEIEELSMTELNQSIRRIQKKSLEYLNNLGEAPSSPQQNV
jgi:hypothetical protein